MEGSMDQKMTNRLLFSCLGVPVTLTVLYFLLRRIAIFVMIRFFTLEHIRYVFYFQYAVMAGATLWAVVFAYSFVRYGDLRILRFNGKKKE
jgi:hypothetical protein